MLDKLTPVLADKLNLTPVEAPVNELDELRSRVVRDETNNRVKETNTIAKTWGRIREAWRKGDKIKVTAEHKDFGLETQIFEEAMRIQTVKKLNDLIEKGRPDPFSWLS